MRPLLPLTHTPFSVSYLKLEDSLSHDKSGRRLSCSLKKPIFLGFCLVVWFLCVCVWGGGQHPVLLRPYSGSELHPGEAQRTIRDVGDRTWVGRSQSEKPTRCPSSLAPANPFF